MLSQTVIRITTPLYDSALHICVLMTAIGTYLVSHIVDGAALDKPTQGSIGAAIEYKNGIPQSGTRLSLYALQPLTLTSPQAEQNHGQLRLLI